MGNLARKWSDQNSRALLSEVPRKADNLETLARELLAMVGASGIAIVHEDPEVGNLVCVVSLGTCVPPRAAQVDPSSGISGRCVRECRTQRCYDARIDPRVERAASEQLGIRSLVVVPLVVGSRCVGLLEAVSDQPGHFDEEKAAVLESAADRTAALLAAPENPPESFTDQVVPAHSSETAQPMDTTALSYPIEEERPEQADADPSHLNAETPLQFGELERDSRRHLRSWRFAVLAAPLITVLVVSYVFYERTNMPATLSHQASTHPSPSDMPSLPALVQNQNTAAVLPGKVNGSDAAPVVALVDRARRGVIPAQINLAEAYMNGDGVEQSPEKAASWYIIAGENGSAKAKRRSIEVTRGMAPGQIAPIRFDVGKMYMDGVGTRKDYVAAYAWFELAKIAGDIRAADQQEKLSTRMQPAQVQEGKHRASIWLQSHLGRVHHEG